MICLLTKLLNIRNKENLVLYPINLKILGVKAVVRKSYIDAGFKEGEVDDIASKLSEDEIISFDAASLSDLTNGAKETKRKVLLNTCSRCSQNQ